MYKAYDPNLVGTLFIPDVTAAVEAGDEWGAANNVVISSEQSQGDALILVDCQIDFVHKKGQLAVQGAVADMQRTIEFVYRNAVMLKTIIASLDNHELIQIFTPLYWVDNQTGKMIKAWTTITVDEVGTRYTPIFHPANESNWNKEYVEKLRNSGKDELVIWPYHTQAGSIGAALDPSLTVALSWWGGVKRTNYQTVLKGNNPFSEHYSIFEAEVSRDVLGEAETKLNPAVMDILSTHRRIYVAGQAKSHCDLESINSMVKYFKNDPDILGKIHIMVDCMSSISGYEDKTENFYNHIANNYGVKLVLSTDY